ncbi:MAG: hypothetical protein GF331_04980 [Chitinivibrionales bacterium]|nr:hypothetical protein [Chitinivibrionales bacterium]
MKRFSVAITACILAGSLATAYGQCDDPLDAILCASALTPTQEAQFDASSTDPSPFWADLTGDYVEVIPPGDCYPDACGFTDASDGQMLLKAAATSKGLYFYAEVQDNVWVDWSGGDSYGDDSVDLYVDEMSADDIWNCTDCLIGLYDSKLTYTTQQYQVFMGGTSIPTTFRRAAYDPMLWSWQTLSLDFATAKTMYGFEVKVVSAGANKKIQEWFFPWQTMGDGIEPGTDVSNTRFGFCAGYNDMDGDNVSPDKLRWPNQKDPWAGDANYWGDILTPADLGAVEAVVAVDGRSVNSGAGHVARADLIETELFNLQGQKISDDALRLLPKGSLIMKRHTLSDGSKMHEMHRIVR